MSYYVTRSKQSARKRQAIQCIGCRYSTMVQWKGNDTPACKAHNDIGVPLAKPPMQGCKWFGPDDKGGLLG
jgi:hypothetical protein